MLLARHGYRTGRIGKYHVAPEPVYHFENRAARQRPQCGADGEGNCEAFIRRGVRQTFFLYFATSDPHRGGGVDKTSPHKPDLFGNKPERGSFPRGRRGGVLRPGGGDRPPFLPDTPACRAELAQYYQSCSRIDQGLGRLVEILKERRQIREHPDRVHRRPRHRHAGRQDDGLRTRPPGPLRRSRPLQREARRPVGRDDQPCRHHPSLLDFAGAYDAGDRRPAERSISTSRPRRKRATKAENRGDQVTKFHGRSWVPILCSKVGPTKGWDEIGASHTFHEIQMYYPMRVVRDRDYKLIWNIAHPLPFPFASDLWIAPTWQAQYKQGPTTKYGQRTRRRVYPAPRVRAVRHARRPQRIDQPRRRPEHYETLERLQEEAQSDAKATTTPGR